MAQGPGGEREAVQELGSKRVAVDIKSVTKIAAPESYQVLWEEHLTEKTRPHRENPAVDRRRSRWAASR